MTTLTVARSQRLPGRAALSLFACLLIPAALLANACSDDDDDVAPASDAGADASPRDGATVGDGGDAALDGSGDATRDATVDSGADAARDGQADAGSDVARSDASDARFDARVDAAPASEAGTDATIDAADAGSSAIDANVEAAAVDVSVLPSETGAPDAGVDSTATLPEAAASEAAAPDARVADATNDAADAAAAADADATTTPPGVQYSFETGVQGWGKGVSTDPTIGSVTTSTVQHDTGTSSLAIAFTSDSDDGTVLRVESPPGLVPGKVVSLRIFIPDDVVSWFDIYDMDANDNWSDDPYQPSDPDPFTQHTGSWWTYTHRIRSVTQADPTIARVAPIQALGLKVGLIRAGTIYIDSITW